MKLKLRSRFRANLTRGWWRLTGREVWTTFIETKLGVVRISRPKTDEDRDEWLEEMEREFENQSGD